MSRRNSVQGRQRPVTSGGNGPSVYPSYMANSTLFKNPLPKRRPVTGQSDLTKSLVYIIQNDFDAVKSMNEDISNILPLQISPDVLGQYRFRKHTSMLRLLKYSSDLSLSPSFFESLF
jgi:hypothetical protein